MLTEPGLKGRVAENQSERRLTPRIDANMPATVWLGATHVGCTVQDVSWLGASLLVPPGLTLPDAFELERLSEMRRPFRDPRGLRGD